MSLLAKSQSVELSRRTQPFYARKASYSLGEQVQIEVDVQREFLDFENSRLFFDLHFTANTTAADTRPIPWVASACVMNLRVKTMAGQMIGHEIREYRAWYRMMKELTSNSDLNTSYLDRLEGAAPIDLPNTAYINQYGHRLDSHIFSIKEYYPAHFHQGIMIEFDLPSSAKDLFTATETLPTAITLQEVRYVADLVQLKPEIENEMVRLMEEQRLFADYMEILTQEDPITASTGLKAYDIVGVDGRVKSIFQWSIRDSNRALNGLGASQVGDYFGLKGRNGLSTYRFKLGSRYLNYESIKTGGSGTNDANRSAEQTYELVKALDMHSEERMATRSGDSANTSAQQDTHQFVVAVKVDKSQSDNDDTISSMIDKDRNNVRIELNYAVAPAGTLKSYSHTVLDKRIQLLPGSVVRSIRS